MHPLNRLLGSFGLRLVKVPPVPRARADEYERQLAALRASDRGFALIREPADEAGEHPFYYSNFECDFAANHVARTRPRRILDVGSYRQLIAGLAAHYPITTIDVRTRRSALANEVVVTGDAKQLPLGDGEVDCVVSLCAIEHFGLGRYGDAFDPEADRKAVREMIRVLAPGGRLVLSTGITRGRPTIAFNNHRIYDRAMVHALVAGLALEEEAYFSHQRGPCRLEDVTAVSRKWDAYCSCWRKDAQ